MTMDCHHCGNFGHKKYECTSKCRVGCKWCEKPPRRQIPNRNSIEFQRQHNTLNIQRTQGSTSINTGQLSLPQQFTQNTNDVRFGYNGSQGHLQHNVTGNVGNVQQQHVPNNIQQLSANLGNLGNLGNLHHHINGNIQNVQVNGTNISTMNQPTNMNNVLFDPALRPLLQKVLESALLQQISQQQHHHHQQQQQQAQVQAQAQHVNNTNIYGLQSSNQQSQTLLNTDYLQRPQPTQYIIQQIQQLLNSSINNANVNNSNVNTNVNNANVNVANVNVNNSNPNNPNINIVNNSNVNVSNTESQAASTLVSHITTTITSPEPPKSQQLSQPHQTSQPQTPQLHPLQLQPPQPQTPQAQPSQLQPSQVQPSQLQPSQLQPPQLQPPQLQPPQVQPPQVQPPLPQLPQPPQPPQPPRPPQPPQPQLPQLPQLSQLPHPPPPQQPPQQPLQPQLLQLPQLPQPPQPPQPFVPQTVPTVPTVPTWNNNQVHVQESQQAQSNEENKTNRSSSVAPTTTAITSIKKEEGTDSHMVVERQKSPHQEEEISQENQEEKTSEQERNIGETNVEILTKLKVLKDKIEKGLHPRIKPKVFGQQIDDDERQQIQKGVERDSRQNNNRYKENGRQNHFSRGTRGRSPIEQRSPTNYHRSRRSRSPYRYDKESIISDYRRYQRNRSRSTSLRRDVRGPNDYSARSVSPGRFRMTEYDERYYFRNSGQEFRDKYMPRGMSVSIYEESRHGERYEDRSRSFGRSRSPIGYPGCRRQNSWYGEQYDRERPGYDFWDYEFSARRRPTNRW